MVDPRCMTLHYSTRRRRAKSTIVSRGKTAISAVYPSRFNDERRAKSSRIKSAIVAYPWRVAQPAEISYAEIRHASRAPGEVVKVDEREEKGKKKWKAAPGGQCRGSDRVNQGHSRWIDFNMVLGHV